VTISRRMIPTPAGIDEQRAMLATIAKSLGLKAAP
jgi:hypothetical protein